MENLIKIYKFNQTSDKKFGTIQLRIQVGFIFAKTPFKLTKMRRTRCFEFYSIQYNVKCTLPKVLTKGATKSQSLTSDVA